MIGCLDLVPTIFLADCWMARRSSRVLSLPLVVLLSYCIKCAQLLSLDFLVSSPTESPNFLENGYFQPDDMVQVKCQYNASECESRNHTYLVIVFDNPARNRLTDAARGACWTEVKIENITLTEKREWIRCYDQKDQTQSKRRSIRVGYSPVQPRNLTVEFIPLESIRLWIDPVKIGMELNDNTTLWTVTYTWRGGPYECGTTKTEQLTSSGSFVACTVNLTGRYQGSGTYDGDHGGSVSNPVIFNVSVSNLFGHAQVEESFDLRFNIRPGKVQGARVVERGETWLYLTLDLPGGIDRPLVQFMSSGNDSERMKLRYTLDQVSERDENRLRPERMAFYQNFGFYRNLQEDEEARTRLNFSLQLPFTKEVPWPDRNATILHLNISGLSPNTYYRVGLRPLARYPGPLFEMPLEEMLTSESVPLQAPSLQGVSPNYCFVKQNCISCVIYFQEIPRPLRLSEVKRYVLTATLIQTTQSRSNDFHCNRASNITVTAGGQQNAILLDHLVHDALYNISLLAHTAKGTSPHSTFTLNAKQHEAIADVDLEVRPSQDGGSSRQYRLSWDDEQRTGTGENVTYYVHYCYVNNAITDLMCKTNLLTLMASINTSSGILTIPRYRGNSTDLQPIFFVSRVQNGRSSGLIKSKWVYNMDADPGPVDWVTVTSPPETFRLEVDFTPTREANSDTPVYGRPSGYVVAWTENSKDSCDASCQALQTAPPDQTMNLTPYRVRPFTLIDLSPSASYCVGVKALKGKNSSTWTCSTGTTGGDSHELSRAVAISASVASFVLLCGLVCVLHRCNTQINIKKAKLKYAVTDLPRPKTTSHQQPDFAMASFTIALAETCWQGGHRLAFASCPASSADSTCGGPCSSEQKCHIYNAVESKETIEGDGERFYCKIHDKDSDRDATMSAGKDVTEAVRERDVSEVTRESEPQASCSSDENGVGESDVYEECCGVTGRFVTEDDSEDGSDITEASHVHWNNVTDDEEESDISEEASAAAGRYVTNASWTCPFITALTSDSQTDSLRPLPCSGEDNPACGNFQATDSSTGREHFGTDTGEQNTDCSPDNKAVSLLTGCNSCESTSFTPEVVFPPAAKKSIVPLHIIQILQGLSHNADHYVHISNLQLQGGAES